MPRKTNFLRICEPIGIRGLSAGFTLIEIVVVIGVLALLGSLAAVSFFSSRNTRDEVASGQNVLSLLRLAQSRALAGEENSAWGVRLDRDRASLFRGSTFATSSIADSYVLPVSLEIGTVALSSGGKDVVFEQIYGTTTQSGTFDVRVRSGALPAFSVAVEPSGKVYQQNAAPSALDSRIKDARHREFTLGWSIQGAATLSLLFSDPPNSDSPVSVPMASYFSGGQVSFDWSGTYLIGGQNQTLRIHTTSLTSGNTILSVDRDCRRNSKKVKISIDGKEIATYEADCATVAVGAYGGTMREP